MHHKIRTGQVVRYRFHCTDQVLFKTDKHVTLIKTIDSEATKFTLQLSLRGFIYISGNKDT